MKHFISIERLLHGAVKGFVFLWTLKVAVVLLQNWASLYVEHSAAFTRAEIMYIKCKEDHELHHVLDCQSVGGLGMWPILSATGAAVVKTADENIQGFLESLRYILDTTAISLALGFVIFLVLTRGCARAWTTWEEKRQ
jgi:hypothetical protein